ncbi:MAG: glutamine--fructose-6-phosphate transaminase (isomerizing) [Proteobacteria bacterium]|nr:glutamine--fructose-6-phosphate transaminase (isomerizing) [Pseudomonadota bacterium]
MCGIVAASASRPVATILLAGLHSLEYRGYDSAGIALLEHGTLYSSKHAGKVAILDAAVTADAPTACVGIAHTRWATHGEPTQYNAHPHLSGNRVAIVHNGIIENHAALRAELVAAGVPFSSDTDSEVIAHLLARELERGLSLEAGLASILPRLEGAYAIAAIDKSHPDQVCAARKGSPLVVGLGFGEHFLASDPLALRQVTNRFIYLEEGDQVTISPTVLTIKNSEGQIITREIVELTDQLSRASKGDYDHYMLKEIHEQPRVLAETVRFSGLPMLDETIYGERASAIFDQVEALQIVACGTSYHAGMVAKYWFEEHLGLPCQIEVASEFRYRKRAMRANTLLLTISQSGETADSLAALRDAAPGEFLASLVIANVDNSALVRESDLVFLTQAGPEIGVASTKAFTTQLVALLVLLITLGKRRGMSAETIQSISYALSQLPDQVDQVLRLKDSIARLSERFIQKHHALFLGRGAYYPIALEGSLKLKEISYIHAEAYPAGELKHGPLALVDSDMPVIAVAPNDALLEKLRSNLEEVRSRGGELYVFAPQEAGFESTDRIHVINMPHCDELTMPIVYTVALQLLSYYVALQKGTDVDKPRNLAKSVTVQ